MPLKNKSGIFWNTLGSAMWGLNSVVMLLAVSNLMSVEETGSFGIAFTTAQILYFIGLFGISHYQMTDYGETYSFRTYAKLGCFSCILMLLCCMLSVHFLQFNREKAMYTYALCCLMALNVIGELIQSRFFQKNRLDLSGSALFFRTLYSLIAFCGILVIYRSIILSIVVQIVVNFLLTFHYGKRMAKEFPDCKQENADYSVKTLFKECVPLCASLLLTNIVVNASKYGVELEMDQAAQGYYSMLFMPVQGINLCSQFLFKPALNSYSTLLKEGDNASFRGLLRRHSTYIILLTVACSVGAWFLGVPVLSVLYGQALSGFRFQLFLLMIGSGLFAMCDLLYYVMVVMRKQRIIFGIYAFTTVLSLGLAFALTRTHGLTGAAGSFLVIHLFVAIAYILAVEYSLKRRKSDA